MARTLCLGLLLVLPRPVTAQSSQPIEAFWTTNATTDTVLPFGSSVYIGGSFTLVGPHSGSTTRFDEAGTGAPEPGLPKVDGVVYSLAPDGAGGWYFGGLFTKVGGIPRTNAAHILADGRVASWNPAPNFEVRALVPVGPVVYAGGFFTSIGGQTRNRIAALDATTGLATPWNPNANNAVLALAVSGGVVYAGGGFTTMGGQTRSRIAAVDAVTGAVTGWDPNASNTVNALAVSGGLVYVGGAFTTIGGQARNRIAALSTASGLATAWNPTANGGFQSVNTLAVADNLVYLGGRFTIMSGQPRNYLAAVDTATGLATSWDPSPNDEVYTLAVSASRVYVGGAFTTIAGQARPRLAAVERTDGSASPWNAAADNSTSALAVAGGRVFAGGAFRLAGGIVRNRLAALDKTTGLPLAWDPNVTPAFSNSSVWSLAEAGGVIYVGGDFTAIGGQPRALLGGVDAATGAVTPWNPGASSFFSVNLVQSLSVNAGIVYAGGRFDMVGGQPRNRIAAADVATGLVTPWNPNASPNIVDVVAAAGSSVYAGGDFSGIGGQTRVNIAELDAATGLATSWAPGMGSNSVNGLAVTAGEVYVGGTFGTMGGQIRERIAAVDRVTGLATAFNPGATGAVEDVAVQGNLVFAAGSFLTFGGQSRTRLAAADRFTGAVTSWAPVLQNTARAVATDTKRVYVGGGFVRGSFAAFCLATPPGGLNAVPAGPNQIDLSWTANGAPSYRVLRTRFAGGPYEDLGTTSLATFSDTAAQGGVTYYYAVGSIDECESDRSPEVSAMTAGTCALAPDFEGAAWAEQTAAATCTLAVGWGDAASPCGGSVSYSVHRDVAPAFVASAANLVAGGLAGTSFVDAGPLPPGVRQYYVVRAVSTLTGLEEGNEIHQSAVPEACAGGGAGTVRIFAARATNGTVKLEWVNPSAGPYVSTRIRYSTSAYPAGANDGLPVTDQTGSLGGKDSYEHTGLANDTVHYYTAFVDQGGSYSAGRFVETRPFDSGTGPVRWAYSTGAAAMAPPGIGSSAIYALSNDYAVHSLLEGDAGGSWPAGYVPSTLGGVAQARPPVVPTLLVSPAAEVLFAGAQDGRVYAVDVDSGALLWPAPPLLGDAIQAAVAGSFTSFGGGFDYLLVGTRNSSSGNEVYALDVASGLPVGPPFDNGGGASAIGLINGMGAVDYQASRFYVTSRRRAGGSSNTLWALDISAGGLSLGWAIDLGDIDGSPVVRSGRIYVGTNAGVVYSVRASDGADLRSYSTNDGAVKGFVFPDRTSNDLFVSTANQVFILEDNGTAVVSKWPAVTVPGPSIPVFDSASRLVFVGGSDGRLYQLDVAGAPVVSSVQLGDGLARVGSPTLNRIEPAVYVGTEAGVIYRVTAPLP